MHTGFAGLLKQAGLLIMFSETQTYWSQRSQHYKHPSKLCFHVYQGLQLC